MVVIVSVLAFISIVGIIIGVLGAAMAKECEDSALSDPGFDLGDNSVDRHLICDWCKRRVFVHIGKLRLCQEHYEEYTKMEDTKILRLDTNILLCETVRPDSKFN